MEYTKGEWKVITNGNNLLAIAIRGRNICSFEPLFLHGEKSSLYRQLGGEDEANANLIASAPDLYEACKMAKAEFEKSNPYDRRDVRFLSKAEQAITTALAKVEGK